MTREELRGIICKWIYSGDWYDICMQGREKEIIDDIMEYVDKYVLSYVMKEKEIKVNKIEPGQPLFPVPTCPKCRSKEYTISSNSSGNVRCSKCGKYFFFVFGNSYGIK